MNADIEKDTVNVALGDPETGEFATLYKTYYPDAEEFILTVDSMAKITHPDGWDKIDAEPIHGIELPSEDGDGSFPLE